MQCDAVIAIRQTTWNAGWAVWLGTGLAVWGGWGLVPPAHAVDPAPTPPAAEVPAKSDAAGKTEGSIEAVAAKSKPAIVVITFQGRDGQRLGLGSGFIISPDGLVATNLHVIGEGRPISVQLADGRTFEPTVVEGYDRKFDLALLRIDAKDLPTVSLGDEKTLKQGQSVVALGNPLGLKHSLFSGLVSGNREIEGREIARRRKMAATCGPAARRREWRRVRRTLPAGLPARPARRRLRSERAGQTAAGIRCGRSRLLLGRWRSPLRFLPQRGATPTQPVRRAGCVLMERARGSGERSLPPGRLEHAAGTVRSG